MKVLKRTTKLLILHPGYSADILLKVFLTVASLIYVLFYSNLAIFYNLIILSVTPVFGFAIIDELFTECTFDKTKNSLIIRRSALSKWGIKRYVLSDINYVDIQHYSAYKNVVHYSVKLQTDGKDIKLQPSLNRKNANKLAQQIGVFLDIPYTKAYLD
jgi:hypothetical protein